MTQFPRRTSVLVATASVLAVVALGLSGCTSTSDEPDATSSPSTGAGRSTVTPTAEPDESAVPTPDAEGGFVTGAPLPGSAGAGDVDEPDPSDYPASPLVTFATYDASASRVEAGGVVSGQLDPAGTCRLMLVQGSSRVVRDSVPQPSASSVDCGQFVVPRAELAPGTWSITLRYVVGSSAASSEAVQVEVPS